MKYMNPEELLNKINETVKTKKYERDGRFWSLSIDKTTGVGQATIRFLPLPDGKMPWVHYFGHNFKVGKRSFVEKCPTTLGNPCPVCEANNELWRSGIKSNEDIARPRSRKNIHIANVYIVSDPAHPENEGKVFLFSYGKMIQDKIDLALKPKYEGEKPMNPFHPIDGANFKLRYSKKEGNKFSSPQDSTFSDPAPLFPDESKIDAVVAETMALDEFISEGEFKSFEDLEKNFKRVTGEGSTVKGPAPTKSAESAESPSLSTKHEADSFNAEEDEELDDLKFFEDNG